jgi:hypothetical protein
MRPQKEKERKAFEAFLQACPSLAVRIGNNWRVQEEEGAFPDVLATSKEGHVLEFELGEWIHEDQVRHAKMTDQFASDVLDAIRPQPENRTQHFHCLMLALRKDRMGFDRRDREKLREELVKLIHETDHQWLKEPHSQSPQGYPCREFARFPTLAKYLIEVWFVPRVRGKVTKEPRRSGIPWIDVEGRGGSYSGESARRALKAIILKKAIRYGGSSGKLVNLLIHYGADAFSYNTPFLDGTTPDFEAVAKVASEVMYSCFWERENPFEKVYLCNTLPFELEAYEIFPQLLRCS